MAEGQLLDDSIPSPPRHQQYQQYQQPYRYQQDPYHGPPRYRPTSHPDSCFERLQAQRAQRRYSQEPANGRGRDLYASGAVPNTYNGHTDAVLPVSLLQASDEGSHWGHGARYPPPAQRPPPQSTVTPGADNFSNAAAGGMAGIALNVAEQNARESGLNAIHDPHYAQQAFQHQPEQGQAHADRAMLSPGNYRPGDQTPHSSLQSLNAAGAPVGHASPGQITPSRSGEIYMDDPYQSLSRHQDSSFGLVNPNDIEDDGDDGLEYGRRGLSTSMLSLGSSHRGRDGAAAAGGAVAGGALGGLVGLNGSGSLSNQYAPVNNGVSGDDSSRDLGGSGGEKGAWKGAAASKGNGKKWRLAILIVLGVLVLAGAVVGILFGTVFKNNKTSSGSSSGGGSSDGSPSGGSSPTAADDTRANGDLKQNSGEIQALMNNPDLRRVFPGMDYTPLNTQFPECLANPPSQNNVTRDLAVLSQLTNTVRLYGTDCNQTQMLIHSIQQLGLKDKVKIWMGVWQDNNATTNARQLSQMWDILDHYGAGYFKGIIVANEILFRKQMTPTQLGALLSEVRANMTSRGIKLPVATGDLGDLWTSTLASQSDAIMANIHPFFAGTPAAEAADWTTYFWGNKTGTFLKQDPAMNIISETGWPSQGGTHCGNAWQTDCPDRAVAGVDGMNTFLESWVCRALDQGTQYFWFSAFDEPWKLRYNTKGKEWEDHWGLLDVNRKLKSGVKIPDCGGKRVS